MTMFEKFAQAAKSVDVQISEAAGKNVSKESEWPVQPTLKYKSTASFV